MLPILTNRHNNIAFIFIFVVLIPLKIFSSLQNVDLDVWQQSAPLSKVVHLLIGERLLENFFFDFFISFVLITMQISFAFSILRRFKKIEDYSGLFCWLYLWLIHLIPEWSKFSPTLISLTLYWYIFYLFYKHVEDNSNRFLFSASLALGVAFLFWYPSIFLIGFLVLLMFQYNALNLKRLQILLLSFSIPLIHFITYYILIGNELEIIYQFSNFHLHIVRLSVPSWLQSIPILIIGISTILGAYHAFSLSSKTAKLTRLFIVSLFTLVPFLIISLVISVNSIAYSLLFLSFPSAFFLAIFINKIKHPIVAEIVHLFLISCFIFHFALELKYF